jgi:hypothetical protein
MGHEKQPPAKNVVDNTFTQRRQARIDKHEPTPPIPGDVVSPRDTSTPKRRAVGDTGLVVDNLLLERQDNVPEIVSSLTDAREARKSRYLAELLLNGATEAALVPDGPNTHLTEINSKDPLGGQGELTIDAELDAKLAFIRDELGYGTLEEALADAIRSYHALVEKQAEGHSFFMTEPDSMTGPKKTPPTPILFVGPNKPHQDE